MTDQASDPRVVAVIGVYFVLEKIFAKRMGTYSSELQLHPSPRSKLLCPWEGACCPAAGHKSLCSQSTSLPFIRIQLSRESPTLPSHSIVE